MRLDTLCLREFRNYRQEEISFAPGVNIFLGRNAQGKTNLLEAVYLLAVGKSFRPAADLEMIRHGSASFKIAGVFRGADGAELVTEYFVSAGEKVIRQNGMPLKRAWDIFGRVGVVLFSPDDLQLLKGGPEYRRAYLDLYLGQTNPQYRHDLYAYQRTMAQRNQVLRRIRDGLAGRGELQVWNESLLDRAIGLIGGRLRALSALAPLATGYHRRLAGGTEQIELIYRLGGRDPVTEEIDLRSRLARELAAREAEEIGRGVTVAGPHRDDLSIRFVTGHDLRSFGSQGQQRTAALAMKLAALDFLRTTGDGQPILLLDDVLSELDDERRRALLSLLAGAGQTLITSADAEEFGPLAREAERYRVDEGRVSRGA